MPLVVPARPLFLDPLQRSYEVFQRPRATKRRGSPCGDQSLPAVIFFTLQIGSEVTLAE